MKARILSLDSDEHRVVQTLLPWHVTGTLDAAETARVEAHLAQCERCQADAAFQARLRAVPVDPVPAGDVDRGWAALRSRLEPRARPMGPAPSGSRRHGSAWLTWALGGQFALIVVLAVATFAMPRQGEPYRTLGAAPSATAANALVVFRPDATEAQMRQALRAADARIVGGPTVTDAYLLRLSDLGAPALARLRAQPGIARVESLEAEATK